MPHKAEIKTVSSNEPNISRRSTHYDLYVDGQYETTFHDVIDAVEERDKINAGKPSKWAQDSKFEITIRVPNEGKRKFEIEASGDYEARQKAHEMSKQLGNKAGEIVSVYSKTAQDSNPIKDAMKQLLADDSGSQDAAQDAIKEPRQMTLGELKTEYNEHQAGAHAAPEREKAVAAEISRRVEKSSQNFARTYRSRP